MSGRSDLVLLGKVVGTHGIKGQLRVAPFSGESETFLALDRVILKDASGKEETYAVSAAAAHGRKILLTLKGMGDINQAQHLVGREIYVQRSQLPPLAEDEFYWFDLIGLRVVTDEGLELGRLENIMETGSNDVYLVRAEGKEYLIPAIEEVVKAIDLDAGVMTISPLEGLLDL